MRVFVALLLAVAAASVKADSCTNKAEVVCYYGSWALYRTFEGHFTTQDIDTSLCTTLIYSFAGLDIDLEISSLDTYVDITQGGFANMTTLKAANPCLKTRLALGGWNEGSLKYSIMASNAEYRSKFADSVLKFLAYYGFDGLDLDWEYPTARGGITADKANFGILLTDLKDRLEPWGLELSIAVGIEDSYYDIPTIAGIVDYVHLMAYDVTPGNSTVTGLSAPLTTIKNAVDIWINSGLLAEKLILGIPTYARCWNLQSAASHDIGALVESETTCGGAWTNQDGFMAYYEVQELLAAGYCQGTQISDDNVFSWCENVWITYDNELTAATKARYAVNAGLGGVMVWSLDSDDFAGLIGQKYTLLNAIYSAINE